MTIIKSAAAAIALLAFAAPASAGGRMPTPDEAGALKSALSGHGFSSWSKIEFNDGKWEIDNAVHADGKVYDVDLTKTDLAVIKKVIDD